MAWISEGTRRLWEVRFLSEDGIAKPGNQWASIYFESIPEIKAENFEGGVVKAEITPFNLEELANEIHETFPPYQTVCGLGVGIRNGKSVYDIRKSFAYQAKGEKGNHEETFVLFRDDKPIVYSITGSYVSSIGARPKILDERLRPYFEELRELRPSASQSIWECFTQLVVPGPDYVGKAEPAPQDL